MSALHVISCPEFTAIYVVDMRIYGIGTLGTILHSKPDNFDLKAWSLSLPRLHSTSSLDDPIDSNLQACDPNPRHANHHLQA